MFCRTSDDNAPNFIKKGSFILLPGKLSGADKSIEAEILTYGAMGSSRVVKMDGCPEGESSLIIFVAST
jgi:hypothetical protein